MGCAIHNGETVSYCFGATDVLCVCLAQPMQAKNREYKEKNEHNIDRSRSKKNEVSSCVALRSLECLYLSSVYVCVCNGELIV